MIAIDGKSCRRSHDASQGLGALHIVSAWASEDGIALGQVATEQKSNEITAIPLLLKQIGLKESIVTIDAMGCQKEIAQDIVDGGGDFVIAVKDNQPMLREAIETHFEKHLESDFEDIQYRTHETKEKGHGRVDERSYFVTRVPRDFPLKTQWPWVKAIGYSLRVTRQPDGSETGDVRYYILSKFLSGKRFSEAVRSHWEIESMHWVLDVNFREDDSRTREAHAGQQSELVETLCGNPSQTPPHQRQHPREDGPMHAEYRVPHRSPDAERRLIRADRASPCVPKAAVVAFRIAEHHHLTNTVDGTLPQCKQDITCNATTILAIHGLFLGLLPHSLWAENVRETVSCSGALPPDPGIPRGMARAFAEETGTQRKRDRSSLWPHPDTCAVLSIADTVARKPVVVNNWTCPRFFHLKVQCLSLFVPFNHSPRLIAGYAPR